MSVSEEDRNAVMRLLQGQSYGGRRRTFDHLAVRRWNAIFGRDLRPALYELRRKGLVEQLTTGDWRLTPRGQNYETLAQRDARLKQEEWERSPEAKVRF